MGNIIVLFRDIYIDISCTVDYLAPLNKVISRLLIMMMSLGQLIIKISIVV